MSVTGMLLGLAPGLMGAVRREGRDPEGEAGELGRLKWRLKAAEQERDAAALASLALEASLRAARREAAEAARLRLELERAREVNRSLGEYLAEARAALERWRNLEGLALRQEPQQAGVQQLVAIQDQLGARQAFGQAVCHCVPGRHEAFALGLGQRRA